MKKTSPTSSKKPKKRNTSEVLRLENQICFRLYASVHKMMKLYRPLLQDLGITYPQYLVFLVLWEKGPSSISSLGERLGLDSGTLTPLLKRLEKEKFLIRNRSSEDERIVLVSLTPKGIALRDKAEAIPETIFCWSGLSKKQGKELSQTLDAFL